MDMVRFTPFKSWFQKMITASCHILALSPVHRTPASLAKDRMSGPLLAVSYPHCSLPQQVSLPLILQTCTFCGLPLLTGPYFLLPLQLLQALAKIPMMASMFKLNSVPSKSLVRILSESKSFISVFSLINSLSFLRYSLYWTRNSGSSMISMNRLGSITMLAVLNL